PRSSAPSRLGRRRAPPRLLRLVEPLRAMVAALRHRNPDDALRDVAMLLDSLTPHIDAPAVAPLACAPCGQPVSHFERGAGRQFCCAGCASVHAILAGAGLDDYYRRRDATGAVGRAATVAGRAYDELDQPEFATLYCRHLPGGQLGTELLLENVHCAACVWLVERVGTLVPGVTEARLDLSRGIVRV